MRLSKHLAPVIGAIALVLMATACSTPTADHSGGTISVDTGPHLTLSAPPTIAADQQLTMVIDSSGHDGEEVQLYAFRMPYDDPATCADTTVEPAVYTLTGGQQSIIVSTEPNGDYYFVLSSGSGTSECGQAKTRVLGVPEIAIESRSWKKVGEDYELDPTVGYWLRNGNTSDGGAPMSGTVTWVGPFATAPDAKATSCPITPVAATDHFTLDKKTQVVTSTWMEELPTPVSAAGIYRLLIAADATEYMVAQAPVCESAPLVTVHEDGTVEMQ